MPLATLLAAGGSRSHLHLGACAPGAGSRGQRPASCCAGLFCLVGQPPAVSHCQTSLRRLAALGPTPSWHRGMRGGWRCWPSDTPVALSHSFSHSLQFCVPLQFIAFAAAGAAASANQRSAPTRPPPAHAPKNPLACLQQVSSIYHLLHVNLRSPAISIPPCLRLVCHTLPHCEPVPLHHPPQCEQQSTHLRPWFPAQDLDNAADNLQTAEVLFSTPSYSTQLRTLEVRPQVLLGEGQRGGGAWPPSTFTCSAFRGCFITPASIRECDRG